MQITLIYNPTAGDDSQPTLEEIELLILDAGHTLRSQSTKEKGWTKSLRKPADLMVVAGGDGTVGKVARRMVGQGMPIAVLPMGTANNISKTLGLAIRPIPELISGWESAERLKIDAGIATGPWGKRYFVEGVGAGLFPPAMMLMEDDETLAQIEAADEKVTYALQVLREELTKSPRVPLRGTLDGEDISGDYVLFEAMHMQFVGPNLFLAPDVDHHDGLFDAVFVPEHEREDLANYLATWEQGRRWPPEFVTRRGKHLQIEWTGYPIHMDDKVWPGESDDPEASATIDLEVEPRALEFLVPG